MLTKQMTTNVAIVVSEEKRFEFLGRVALLNGQGLKYPIQIKDGTTHLIEEFALRIPELTYFRICESEQKPGLSKKLMRIYATRGDLRKIPSNATMLQYLNLAVDKGLGKVVYGEPEFYNESSQKIK